MFHTIRWRITWPFVILILSTMIGLGILLSNFVRQTYLNNLKDKLITETRMVGDVIRPIFLQGNQNNDLDIAAKHWAGIIGARVTIIATDGTVLGESDEDRTTMTNHLDRPEVAAALKTGSGTSTRFSQTVGFQMLYTATALSDNGKTIGIVRIAVPLQQVEDRIRQLQGVLATTTIIITLLAIIFANLISISISHPIRRLTDDIQNISSDDYSLRIVHSSSDEIDLLSYAFNKMSIQIQNQISEIEAERTKLAAVLDKMNDGILIIDGKGIVQLINPAAENMFACVHGSVVGLPLIEVTQDYQSVELWKKCFDSGENQSAEFEISNKKIQVQVDAALLGPILPDHILLLFQDITKQVQIDAVRRDFISNVSHELRTPLAGIKALTETLQNGAIDDPPAAHRFLERIETEVDSLSLMVSELLELSRIESGRVPLELKPTKPIDVVKPAFDRMYMQAERAGLMLIVDCPDDLPQITADAFRLQQVVVNLIHNSIKFTPEGGKVLVSAVVEDKYIRFSVSDTGKGISSSDLPRIFERFFKADRSRSSSGTGLGLAIARHTVEVHNGKIFAESTIGKGSTFSFIIPLV
jgi:two-component system phosphate regulon sensor histidine kinase PhoR